MYVLKTWTDPKWKPHNRTWWNGRRIKSREVAERLALRLVEEEIDRVIFAKIEEE